MPRIGPQGELIEVYDFGKDAQGVQGYTVYVHTGNTLILAGA